MRLNVLKRSKRRSAFRDRSSRPTFIKKANKINFRTLLLNSRVQSSNGVTVPEIYGIYHYGNYVDN